MQSWLSKNWFRHVFDYLNNFLSLRLSPRTSPFRKRLSFFGVGLLRTVDVFLCEVATQDTYFNNILTPSSSSTVAFHPYFAIHLNQKTSNSSLNGSSISPYTIKQSQNKIKEATNSNDLSGNMRFKLSICDWYISILFSAHSVGSLCMEHKRTIFSYARWSELKTFSF